MKLSLVASTILLAFARAQTTTTDAHSPTVSALEECHAHGLVQYCVQQPGGEEIAVTTATSTAQVSALPKNYTNCHGHDGETYCEDPSGKEVFIPALAASSDSDHAGHADEHEEAKEADSHAGKNCHFHAGVEHCTGGSSAPATCDKVNRSYNIPLRIGSIFIVLVTSAMAVFLPMALRRFTQLSSRSIVFTLIKQFGAGVIIATAFVHLLTHAELMFSNECVGELMYEATTTAIAMAGLFIAFVVEYSGHRYISHRADQRQLMDHGHSHEELGDKGDADSEYPSPPPSAIKPSSQSVSDPGCHGSSTNDDKLSVFVMEMGIIFHSILIGITLVVAGDSGFTTLLIVIIFHQAFEGLALGTRISALSPASQMDKTKVSLAGLFSLITPIGMAIGIGVRNHFNGSDKNTLIALGTLDAFSAGILVWVGLVEMLAHDWLYGELRRASLWRTLAAGASLVSGMVLMGVLGKWA